MQGKTPIGVFDSGYGGLTILSELVKQLPQYDYLYLGDNARAPYGTRSFDTVYQYTLEAVNWFFSQGCELVILACNTASAKALRTIQQNDLPKMDPQKRVLGVIRPTSEVMGHYSKSDHIGILATQGTVLSESYLMEIHKFFPTMRVSQEACPIWVPLIENLELDNPGTRYFVEKHISQLLAKDPDMDTILLGCTHYPLLMRLILEMIPSGIQLLSQGEIVAKSLMAYLNKHTELANKCSKNGQRWFFTTDNSAEFDLKSKHFYGSPIHSEQLDLAH